MPALPNREAEAQGFHHEYERIFLWGDLVRRRATQRTYGSGRLPTHGDLGRCRIDGGGIGVRPSAPVFAKRNLIVDCTETRTQEET